MSVIKKIEYFQAEFNKLPDWQERYRFLIQLGKKLDPYPEEHRLEKFKVTGCQSQVWLYPKKQQDCLKLYADSDAMIVKGLLALVLEIFSEQKIKEIIAAELNFVDDLGLTRNLTQNRTHGLFSFIKQIKLYAWILNQNV